MNEYIIALETEQKTEFFQADLEDIKNVLKQPISTRVLFVKKICRPLEEDEVEDYGDLVINADLSPLEFWEREGNKDWRDFLIEVTK